jgi:tetratricopeptide (TPR) repeat protein
MSSDPKPPSLAETMLADTVAASSSSGPQSRDARDAPVSLAPDSAALARGATIGRYIVLERLGSGGMGVVYAAYDPELDRRVALKLLRPEGGGDVSEGRARLLREAQAIARLSHPNVIAVHDVGTIDDQVFVAMELVDGVTLAAWLEEPHDAEAILAAFVQAGRGLEAAHRKGLVHRDFKPENVLVGKDDRVRVLDFGLAYAERARSEPPPPSVSGSMPSIPAPSLVPSVAVPSVPPATVSSGRLDVSITRTGAFMGTPLYMSPEQFGGRRTEARTDQFSFCVALYDALYGAHPFDGGKTFAELQRAVTSGKRRAEPAGKRVPARVKHALDRGLRVKPAERFPTMGELLDALRPEPPKTRARAWTAVAIVAVVIGGVVAARVMRAKPVAVCEGSSQRLVGAWDDARRAEAQRAFQATGKPYADAAFRSASRSLDAYASAWATMHGDACMATRVRGEQSDELLDLRMQCLGERLAELRALGDLFTHADAEVVEMAPGAAQSLSGLDTCANAVALKAPVRMPSDAAKRAAVAAVRERLAKARALEGAGKYPEMLDEASAAVADAARVGHRPIDAEASFVLGRARMHAGDAKGARLAHIDALVAAEASRHDAVAAEAWPALVDAEGKLQDFVAADESARHGAAAIERVGGSDELTARLESAIGDVAWWRGSYDEALAHHRTALALVEKRVGPDDPLAGEVLRLVAHDLTTLGKYDEAIAGFSRALGIAERALGPDHPTVGQACISLSNVNEYAGNAEKARAFAERGLAIAERALGPDHPQVASALVNLGNACDDLGDYDCVDASYRRALAIRERALGPESHDVADVVSNMAEMFLERRAWADAVTYAERALAIREKLKGKSHPEVATSLTTLGRALCALGRCKDALEKHRRALAIMESTFGAEHPDVADALLAVGVDLLALHDAAAAVPILERADALHEKLDVSERERAESGFALARALWDSRGDRARARKLVDAARKPFVAGGARTHESLADVDAWLRAHPR